MPLLKNLREISGTSASIRRQKLSVNSTATKAGQGLQRVQIQLLTLSKSSRFKSCRSEFSGKEIRPQVAIVSLCVARVTAMRFADERKEIISKNA